MPVRSSLVAPGPGPETAVLRHLDHPSAHHPSGCTWEVSCNLVPDRCSTPGGPATLTAAPRLFRRGGGGIIDRMCRRRVGL